MTASVSTRTSTMESSYTSNIHHIVFRWSFDA